MTKKAAIILAAAVAALATGAAEARSYHKTYGYKTLDKGEAELVYWSEYVAASGNKMPYFGKGVDRKGLWSNTFEVEYGVTDRFNMAAYVDTESPSGEDTKVVQAHAVLGRYRLFEKGERFFDTTLYVEYYMPRVAWQGVSKERLETRVILQKDFGDIHLMLNPKFEKVISGPNVTEGMELEYAAGIYKTMSPVLELGWEAYGNEIGSPVDLKDKKDQMHDMGPTAIYKITKALTVNATLLFGLTEAADDTTVRAIFEYEI